jgi:osmotically-inducible protein OsmY
MMKNTFIFLVGLLLLGVLGYVCVYSKADLIQYRLSQQIQQHLSDKRFKYVELHVNGRNVLLKGEIASTALKQQVESLANVDGVYHLDNQIKVIEVPKLLSKGRP